MKRKKLNPGLGFLLGILLLAGSSPTSYGQPTQLEAIIDGSRHILPISYFPENKNVQFTAVENLADILNLQTYYSNNARKAIVYLGDKEIKITALNPFVAIDDLVMQMPVETRYKDGEIFVPVTHFLQVVSPYFKGRLILSKSRRKNAAVPEQITSSKLEEPTTRTTKILSVVIEEKANGTLIRIKTDRMPESSHINSRITNGWLYVDIYRAKIDDVNPGRKKLNGLVQKIVPVQLSQSAQLSFKLTGEVTSRKIYSDNNENEILVSLTTEETVSMDLLQSLEDERQKWRIDTIVIDPGHGGHDPGAIGPGNVYEKNVTLAIALKLQKLFEERSDIRVVMTRNKDRFVPLKDRTQMANHEQGKLFISIHANSNRSSRVRGLTTYFLGRAKTEEALEVSRRENAVINYEKDKTSYMELETEGFILQTLAQNEYQQESEELAAIVQAEVSKRTQIRNRGVKQAGYYVLIGASMPNILVETAFISNRREAKLLNTSKFQLQIAEGIFASVMKFKKKYEEGI